MSRHVLALLIGVETYPHLDNTLRLRGCLPDVEAMSDLLRERCPSLDLRVLRDGEATRDAVLAALDSVADAADADTEVLFYWSGHGSQVRDLSGDEDDGWDETLVPFDSGRGAHPNRDIVDDEIRAWLARLNETTRRVTLVIDACHSGTVARVGVRLVPRDPRPAAVVEAPSASGPSGPSGWLPISDGYVLLAACRDEQVAIELPFEGGYRGVFSWALEKAVRESPPDASWQALFAAAEATVGLALLGSQTPQLEGRASRLSIFESAIATS